MKHDKKDLIFSVTKIKKLNGFPMKYVATYLGEEIIIETDFEDMHTLVEELNEGGFALGSGHDGIEVQRGEYDIILICTPYVGKMPQYIYFRSEE